LVAACSSEQLALAPAAGVDLSGHWRLNTADSDDPMRLAEMRNASSAAGANAGGQSGGGGRRGRGGQSAGAGQLPNGPVIPAVSSIGEALQWPGPDLTVKQSSGVAVFSSDGAERSYQPARSGKKNDDGEQQVVGWDDRSLVVEIKPEDASEAPLTERFQLSADGQRLIQQVTITGGRSTGFSLSRVWDRVP
jgi:anti-sigma factor RsiW